MAKEDLGWLIDDVGLDEEIALSLLSAADWAEMKRLIDIYGYPKDNVAPPSLKLRLTDRSFAENVRLALDGDPAFLEALDRVIHYAGDVS